MGSSDTDCRSLVGEGAKSTTDDMVAMAGSSSPALEDIIAAMFESLFVSVMMRERGVGLKVSSVSQGSSPMHSRTIR
jgi:hypothetical protein